MPTLHPRCPVFNLCPTQVPVPPKLSGKLINHHHATPLIAIAAPVVDIADLARHMGETVTLRGWVYHLRSSGKVRFLVVRDGTGLAQGVLVKGKLPDDDFQQLSASPWKAP